MRLQARIRGRVQGVGFRYYTEREAHRLGLKGWVRNLPSGEVELLAEGEEESLRRFLEWCHEGPPSAAVTGVTAEWSTAAGTFTDFRTRR